MAKQLFFAILFFCAARISASELPEDELQVSLNSYFDNFNVSIIYPDIAVTKSVGPNTSMNARILVDAISAASMRSNFENVYSTENVNRGIDAYSSATSKEYGGGDDTPDELRKEFGLGLTQIFGDLTLSLNALLSSEHDYRSKTIAISASYPFAKKNTIAKLGFVKSFDNVFPEIRTWEETKDVTSITAGISQILSKNFIMQGEFFFSSLSGFLSDPYQVITISDVDNDYLAFYEPISPSERTRTALGIRGLYGLTDNSSLELGYRFYDDDWEIQSHTIHGLYKRAWIDDSVRASFGLRYYTQSKAYFFGETFTEPQNYMAVDPKLDKAFSTEIQFKFTANGKFVPLIRKESIQMYSKINFFIRNTESADWHSRYKTLYAWIFSLGTRIKI